MDAEYIEQLLERYWRCETTVEEEAQLRGFFCGNEVPERLQSYRELFVYQQLQQEEGLGEEFDSKILARIEAPVVRARRLTPLSRLVPLCKAAAAVAVVLLLGNLMQHSFQNDGMEMPLADTIGEQVSAPSVALSVDRKAAYGQQMLDSLKQDKQQKEEEQQQ